MYWSTKFCLWNIVKFKHLRDLIKSTNFPPLIKQKSLHVFSVQISEVRQFSLVHWALACVVAGQGAAQQISIHLSFLIFAVSAECCLSWPMTVKEMFRPLWVTLSSVVNEQSEKSLRIILTFATKKKKKNQPTTCHFDLRYSRGWVWDVVHHHLSTCTTETYLSETLLKFWWRGERVSASEILSNMLKTKREDCGPTDTTIVNHSVWNYWQLRVVGCCNPFRCACQL